MLMVLHINLLLLRRDRLLNFPAPPFLLRSPFCLFWDTFSQRWGEGIHWISFGKFLHLYHYGSCSGLGSLKAKQYRAYRALKSAETQHAAVNLICRPSPSQLKAVDSAAHTEECRRSQWTWIRFLQTWIPVTAIWSTCQGSEKLQLEDNKIDLGYLEVLYRQLNHEITSWEEQSKIQLRNIKTKLWEK